MRRLCALPPPCYFLNYPFLGERFRRLKKPLFPSLEPSSCNENWRLPLWCQNRCPYTAGTFTSGRIISRGLGKYKHFLNNSGFPESVMNWDFVPSWPYHLGVGLASKYGWEETGPGAFVIRREVRLSSFVPLRDSRGNLGFHRACWIFLEG